ncbi:hypothetical protein [Beijerinckia sp. L45]|uniref:hypothetical protein n=1 Tax=Beijerinckia sp. L45 TaxID=1641855 RepID=UPI00131CB1C6|nr:hypothetical protein [Beijerinckia sp. L45]
MIIAPRRAFVLPAATLFFVVLSAGSAPAQKLKVHNTYGSPLDTLKNTHLTTTVPPAKDFVRSTSPDKDKLEYAPLTGTDPERPKPRDAKQVKELQAELESAGAKNEGKAKGMLPRKPIATRKARTAETPADSATR